MIVLGGAELQLAESNIDVARTWLTLERIGPAQHLHCNNYRSNFIISRHWPGIGSAFRRRLDVLHLPANQLAASTRNFPSAGSLI
jgi:hypothetical protein